MAVPVDMPCGVVIAWHLQVLSETGITVAGATLQGEAV